MKWKKVSPELVELLADSLEHVHCEKKMMFGCPAYFINNNMFSAVHQDSIILRLSEEDREAIFEEYDEIMIFEPMEGRKMREYVVVPEPVYGKASELNSWIQRSVDFVSAMPPKEKKPRKKVKK